MPADPTTLRERVARVVFTGGINQHDLAAIDAAIRIVVEACAEVADERRDDETSGARGLGGNMLFQAMAAADCANDIANAIRALSGADA